jgi:hypothetical protein
MILDPFLYLPVLCISLEDQNYVLTRQPSPHNPRNFLSTNEASSFVPETLDGLLILASVVFTFPDALNIVHAMIGHITSTSNPERGVIVASLYVSLPCLIMGTHIKDVLILYSRSRFYSQARCHY